MLLLILVVSGVIVTVASESCYYHRCMGCRPEAQYLPGTPVECGPENWVSPEWITNNIHPPPSTGSRVPIEYRCLKIVSSPEDSSLSNTIDIVKGCIPERKVDGTCSAILSMQRSRGYTNSKCYVCWGDNCNSGYSTTAMPLLLICFISFFTFMFYK